MSLPKMDVAARLGRLRERLPDASCDALLLTNLVNIRYLTGFSGSAALLVVLADDALLVTDGRYTFQAAEELERAGVDARIEVGGLSGQRDAVAQACKDVARVGLEATHVTWARQRAFAADWLPAAELVATEGLVEDLRRIKDDGEVARIAEACRIADAALAAVLPRLAERITESQFAIELDFEIRRLGASGNSFESIVASGPNGAKPHARPSDRQVKPGELVVLDFGAMVDGYCSDMTRTVCVGPPASPTLARMVDVVAESQQVGVDAVRAGVDAAAVDKACRDVIDAAGWVEAFMHSTGHGVGLDIHEAPAVSATSTDTLAVGEIVTVEPGVYLPEHGGVRIEDTVVVTADGCRRLTNAPKDLILSP